ncbi:polysaccharide biosynthesis tyrosine autokinase [Nostoc sp. FACHB-110]|uniref:GumC family protein n=1 Tax=Nostoc sp. FACHB-110 TaxID=2692834 RepID=UPI001688048F|nr:polysaccharide biosynthesis tyrosine autokinase [Nostoc sp. FACHB-110]MBD2441117.1 polysaccharide biosynthesis tyrosine autokinase [Nostoc sp. FACHB-110]
MLNTDYPLPTKSVTFNHKDDNELHIKQILSVLRRRFFLISGVTALVATTSLPKAEQKPTIYIGSFEILTKPLTQATHVIDSNQNTADAKISSTKEISSVETIIQVLRSPQVIEPIVDKLKQKYPALDYHQLADSLVINSEVPNIVNVQYTSSDQKLADDVAKLLADAYLQYSLKETQLNVNQVLAFVNQQTKSTQAQVKYWQEQLRKLQTENNLIEPGQKYQELTSQVASLQQQQTENRLQLEELTAKYQDLQKEISQKQGERASNSLLSENQRYQKILEQIQALDVEIAQKSAVFWETHPEIITLKEKKAYLLPLLAGEEIRVQRELQSQIRSLAGRDRFLENQIKTLNHDIKYIVTLSRNYDNIQQQLQTANSRLAQITAKQQALEIEKAQKQQPWQLLQQKLTPVNQPAVISDNAKRNFALEGALGLILGVGAALVVDKLSNIFYSAQELKNHTKLPLLGTVAWRKELNRASQIHLSRRLLQTNRASLFDIFHSLYSNMMLLGADSPISSVVISSASQGEGKSTVAVHLAQVAAAMGKRVLLVDTNLRCPSLHQRVGVLNIQGLTDVITQSVDWQNIIERSPIKDNLYILTAGQIPPDSARLLASQKMQHLMSELQANFDLVIYDTPSLLESADAHLLAANSNGIVLVAGLGHLKRTALQQVLSEIQVSGISLLGIVANKSKDAKPVVQQHYQQHSPDTISVLTSSSA